MRKMVFFFLKNVLMDTHLLFYYLLFTYGFIK